MCRAEFIFPALRASFTRSFNPPFSSDKRPPSRGLFIVWRKKISPKRDFSVVEGGAGLRAHQALKRRLVTDRERGTLQCSDLLLAKFSQHAGQRLTRCSDDLCDFFMGKREFHLDFAFLGETNRPFEEQARKALGRRVRKA